MMETKKPRAYSPFQQGDIIKITQKDSDALAPNYGVIINADCDIENDKIDCMYAYLPVYSFKNYLELFWMPSYFSRELKVLLKNIADVFKFNSCELNKFSQWINNDDPNKILSTLQAEYTLNQKTWKRVEACFEKITELLEIKKPISEKFQEYCSLQPNSEKYIRKQLSDAKKSLGDSNLFISEICGLSEIGFVIRVSRIFAINTDSCFQNHYSLQTSLAQREPVAYRISRLSQLYTVKVSQVFAYQYSRVGLSNEVMRLSDLVLDDLVNQFT